jgi:hypothetical protein
MVCSILVSERRHHGKRRFRLDLSNGIRIAALTTVADDPRTMLTGGLALQRRPTPQARTNAKSVISVPPFTL